MTCYRLSGIAPEIAEDAYVAREATVIGKVRLGEKASIWAGAVLRGDNELISVGDFSNIQEGSVLHTDPGKPLDIGRNVTVGHQAMLHGCTIGNGTLIGIQAVVLNGAVIGEYCLVGAGALITEGKVFPDRSMIIGSPAKVVRQLTDEEVERLKRNSMGYVERGQLFRNELEAID